MPRIMPSHCQYLSYSCLYTDTISANIVFRIDFEVKLVSAETMEPLNEFEKDGKIYVEAEPALEYYISIRREDPTIGPSVVICEFHVDSQSLSYVTQHDEYESILSYNAVFSRVDGYEKHRALQFIIPISSQGYTSYLSGMGRVDVNLMKASMQGARRHLTM